MRALRNDYMQVLAWVEAGETVQITRRGRIIARLTPEPTESSPKVDWSKSAAFKLKHNSLRKLTAKEASSLLADSRDEN